MLLSPTPELRTYRWMVLIAAVLMLLPLPVMQYIGEEGLMAIKSYEMFLSGDWLHTKALGMVFPHPPVWHWPVIVISQVLGWEHVDIAIRLVSVMATWMTAALVGWMAYWLFPKDREVTAWLAALVYLSLGEVCFWYGWLGYIDALFGTFVFASIAALWKAMEDKHVLWLCAALIALSLAFLIKNITAYAMFFASALVLMIRLKRWALLKHPLFIILPLASLAVPSLWQSWTSMGAAPQLASSSLHDIALKFSNFDMAIAVNHWLTYPLVFWFRSLPLALFFVWLGLKYRQRFQWYAPIVTVVWIVLICFMPFWLSPGGGPRYLIPLYGWIALLLTGLLLQLDRSRMRQSIRLIAFILILKVPYSLLILPYVKDQMPERNIKAVAHEIVQVVQGEPLRTQSDVANGLSIAAYIDVWQQDKPPIHWYDGHEKGVYILAEEATPSFGRLVKTWRLRGSLVYLYHQD